MAELITFGPSGGAGGILFDDSDAGRDLRTAVLTAVNVRHGSALDQIQAVYSSGGTDLHGGQGGTPDTFSLGGEKLARIEGTYSGTVNSIQFITDQGRLSPVFGTPSGAPFMYQAFRGQAIVGFFGRSGALVDAIGVIIRS